MKYKMLCLTVLVGVVANVYADWPIGFTPIAYDRRGEYIARIEKVEEGHPLIHVYRLDEGKESFQRVESFLHAGDLAPNDMVITEGGKFLVTFDNAYRMGAGRHVVAVYDHRGVLLKSWRLEGILSPRDLCLTGESATSRLWRDRVVVVDSEHPQIRVSGPRQFAGGYEAPGFVYSLNLEELHWEKIQ